MTTGAWVRPRSASTRAWSLSYKSGWHQAGEPEGSGQAWAGLVPATSSFSGHSQPSMCTRGSQGPQGADKMWWRLANSRSLQPGATLVPDTLKVGPRPSGLRTTCRWAEKGRPEPLGPHARNDLESMCTPQGLGRRRCGKMYWVSETQVGGRGKPLPVAFGGTSSLLRELGWSLTQEDSPGKKTWRRRSQSRLAPW